MNEQRSIIVGIDVRLIGKQRTGDEVVFFQLVRELVRQHDSGIQYQLFTDETSDDRLAALRLKIDALGRADIEIISLPVKNRFWWNLWALPWRLFRYPIDIFHTQYILPLFLPKPLKVVTHIHDISFRIHPEWIGWIDRFFLTLFMPRTFARSDKIITPSGFTQTEILAQYKVPAERVVVVENAAAEEWFLPLGKEEMERIIRGYGLVPGGYFLSSGTMQPRKNIPFLIEACALARKTHSLHLPLVLTGNFEGHNVDTQLQEAVESKSCILVGYVSDSDLRALMAGAAAFIFPSLYEGFGIPIEEALAIGTPVLASDIAVFHEVGRDRVHYFDPYSLAPLAEILYTFSIDISLEERQTKRPTKENTVYSWQKSAAKLATLYRSVAADTPR